MSWLFSLFGSEFTWRAFRISRNQTVLLIAIAASIQVAVVLWNAFGLMIDGAIALIPQSPLSQFAMQFLPSRTVLVSGITFWATSMVSLRMWSIWRDTIRKAIGMTTSVWTKM